MKYKTAFRLALRAIGVLLMAQGLPWILSVAAFLVLSLLEYDSSGFGGSFLWRSYVPTGLSYLVTFLLGLYLFFGGRWIVNRAIPSNRPYCHECAYELTGLPPAGVCPECGTPYHSPVAPHGSAPAPPL